MNLQKKGFTLIEVTITIVIISLLIGVIFEVYVVIGRMAVFIQGQKELHNELIYIVQTIQNFMDDQDVELVNQGSLPGQFGFDRTLELSNDGDKQVANISFTRVCNEPDLCHIELDMGGVQTALTNTGSVHINNFYIKKLPLVNQSAATFQQRMHDGFWLFMDVQVPFYDQEKWRFRVGQKIQLFFTLRKY